jgi:DNA damage-binding protein 1
MLTHPDPEFIILGYSESEEASAQLIVQKSLSLFERLPRIAEFFTDFLVHPSGKLAIVSCYAGKLKVITLKAGNFQEEFDVSYVQFLLNTSCGLTIYYHKGCPKLTYFH